MSSHQHSAGWKLKDYRVSLLLNVRLVSAQYR